MKILHVTHHEGCKLNFEFVCKQLRYELTTQFADWSYNVTRDLADEIWLKNADFYNSFDVVLTSDTAPLSRIFLRDAFQKKLLVWVCNRFNYTDESANQNKLFPDSSYYDVFRDIITRHKVFSYTPFEHEYAKKRYLIDWGDLTIKPCAQITPSTSEIFPDGSLKKDTFFITRYHNDNILLDLKKECDLIGLKTYRGEYDGPSDLSGVKGIIHIPYAWSNLALFENWSLGNVYFIPSKEFLLRLSMSERFFWSPPFDWTLLEQSEWYNPEHKKLFIFFDSFDHLRYLVNDESMMSEKKHAIKEFSQQHLNKTLTQWKSVIG